MAFYPNDKVTLIGEIHNKFKDAFGITEWIVDRVLMPMEKNGVTWVICYPIKEGNKNFPLFQFTKDQLKKL